MLFLVRHGRTSLNKSHKLQGRIDLPLDEFGVRQGKAIAGALPNIDHVISSSLKRAFETAKAIGKPVTVDDRWIELDYGDFDGMLPADVPESTWAQWRADSSFRPPNGESLDELDLRVRTAIEDIYLRAQTENIAIVSHVSPIKAAIAWSMGATVGASWRCLLDPASISIINIRSNGPAMYSFNNTAHLIGI